MRSLPVAAVVMLTAACAPAPDAELAVGTMDQARAEVARAQELQYRNIEASASPADRCERAKLVAQAWQQAGDQAAYSRWKATSESDCSAGPAQ